MSYERPNERWICGHACEGKSCRIGPSRWGRCRATFECQPVKDGSRWRCTRPKSDGGQCENGPLPDGTCCRAIPRCSPVRSLRAKRGLVVAWTVAATVGVLLLTMGGAWRGQFINPAPLSQAHTAIKCSDCHVGTDKLIRAALAPVGVDCLHCHVAHDFHNVKAAFKPSCAVCHDEHSGPGKMPAPANSTCAQCHHMTSLAGHPEFRQRADVDTLKFNHQKHLTGDIPLLGGHKLDCANCHKPDATGTYMQPVTYEANCRSCHALQIDANNPELVIPHGNATAARAFLHSLPTQYADLATKKKLPIEDFVTQQMLQLRDQERTGEDLEQRVFFNAKHPGYLGCALCHEVKAVGEVTTPVIPARWLADGRFNHAKHATVSCDKCHEARQSRETADVLLPAKASCATCHSPAGGATDSCATCHTYHFKVPGSAETLRTAAAHPDK